MLCMCLLHAEFIYVVRFHDFQMPAHAVAGNYTMQVLGSTEGAGFLFQNDTKLDFQAKSVSMFIQTDKFLYNKRQRSEQSDVNIVHSVSSNNLQPKVL